MKQIIQEDIVVSIKGQKTHTGCQYIDIGYISKVRYIGLNRLYFNETPDGIGAYDIKNFRHATPEEIKAYEEKGPHVLQKEEDLKGRWLKALVDNPQSTTYKKGEYAQIFKKYDGDAYEVALDDRLQFGASPSKKDIWELMPEGFDPRGSISKNKYNVGDWVLAKPGKGAGSWTTQVVQLQPLGNYPNLSGLFEREAKFVIKPFDYNPVRIDEHSILRHATREEIPTPKDKEIVMEQYVELKQDSSWGVKKGAICKIIEQNRYSSNQWVVENIYIPNTQKHGENKLQFFIVKSACQPSTKEAYEAQAISSIKKEEEIKPKEIKYSVGDYVVCIGDINKSTCGNQSGGWEKNLCFVIKRVTKHSKNLDILWEGKYTNGVYEDQVRRATKEEADECRIHGDMYIIKDKQDLIKEAEKRYPIGTKFISFRDQGRIREVKPYTGQTTVTWSCFNGEVRSDNGLYTKDVNGVTCCSNPTVYENGVWATIVEHDVESELDKWLRETKAKNMSLEDLEDYIEDGYTCPFDTVYALLEGIGSDGRAEILYKKWYPGKIISTGKSDYIMGIDSYEKEEEQTISIKHQAPILLVKKKNTSKLIIINK